MRELTNEELAFAEFLEKYHKGRQNAVVTKRLRAWGTGVKIRAMVHNLRVHSFPICSGSEGYYYAETVAELEKTLNFLGSHIKEVEVAYNGMKKAHEKMVLGQVEEKGAIEQVDSRYMQLSLF